MAEQAPLSTSCRTTPRSKIRTGSDYIVTVKVHGYCYREFSVHREALCRTSEVMKERLNCITVKEKTIRDVNPYCFDLYVNWLYSGLLCTRQDVEGVFGPSEYQVLIEGYLLGIKLKDSTYCDTIITALLEKAEESRAQDAPCLPEVAWVNKVYSQYTPETQDQVRRLREVLVDIFARQEHSSRLEQIMKDNDLSRVFIYDVIRRLKGDLNSRGGGNGEEPARKRRRQE